jgi:hypothetical protein
VIYHELGKNNAMQELVKTRKLFFIPGGFHVQHGADLLTGATRFQSRAHLGADLHLERDQGPRRAGAKQRCLECNAFPATFVTSALISIQGKL